MSNKLEQLLFDMRLWPPDRWLVVYTARRWAAGGEVSRRAERAYAMLEEQRRLFVAIDGALGEEFAFKEFPRRETDASDFPLYEVSYVDVLLCSFDRTKAAASG